MNKKQAQDAVNHIFSLYDRYGKADYIGEPVSQLEHMCQAAQLAEAEFADPELVLAAFFHDIGHLCEQEQPVERMGDFGVADHEELGARYLLQHGFSERMAKLVQSHVAAKRYLTAVDDSYYDRLSQASKETLRMQGGRMNDTEKAAFEADPYHQDYIRLRHWDDQAKMSDLPLPDLSAYRAMAVDCLLQTNPE